jgi:transcriptional regulator with XRE-family HTH domain
MPVSAKNAASFHRRLPLGGDGARALGGAIRAARLRAEMRLEDLSAASGVHRSQISRIERGLALTLTPTVRRLCEYLSIPLPGPSLDDADGLALSRRLSNLLRARPEAKRDMSAALARLERKYGVREH